MDYIHLIENTINYIEENLEEELTLDVLSQQVYISKYFFSQNILSGCRLFLK